MDRLILKFQNGQVSDSQVNAFLSKVEEIESNIDGSTQVKSFGSTQVKSLKNKESKRGTKRKKGWGESRHTNKQKKGGSSTSQIKVLLNYQNIEFQY